MKLTRKIKPNLSHQQRQIINELSYHTTKFYNIVNYQIRENDDIKPVYSKLDKKFKHNWHCDYLMAHNRQHCLKVLAKDWKSYFNSLENYQDNPAKYQDQPNPPGFKHMNSNRNQIIYTNEVTRLKEGNLVLSLQKSIKDKFGVKELKFELSPTIQSLIKSNYLQQVKIKWNNLTQELKVILLTVNHLKVKIPISIKKLLDCRVSA